MLLWLLLLTAGTARALVDFSPFCDYDTQTCTLWPSIPEISRPSMFHPDFGAPMGPGWTLYVVPCLATCTPPHCKVDDFTTCASFDLPTIVWTQETLSIPNMTIRSGLDDENVIVYSDYRNITGIFEGTGLCSVFRVVAPNITVRGFSMDVYTHCGASLLGSSDLAADHSGVFVDADAASVINVGVTGGVAVYATDAAANLAVDTVRITPGDSYELIPNRQPAAVACFYQNANGGNVSVTGALNNISSNVAIVTGYGGATVHTDSTVLLLNLSRIAYMTPKEVVRVVTTSSTSKAHSYIIGAIMAMVLVVALVLCGVCIHKSMAHHEKLIARFDKHISGHSD